METNTPKRRYLAGLLVAVVTIITTYLVHTNPVLNLADLTSVGDNAVPADHIYVPTYTATTGDDGLIEINTHDAVIADFDAITFTMNYSPVDALSFDSNPIVFDGTTEFSDAAFQMAASPEPGKLAVTIVLDDPYSHAGPDLTLFKLETFVNANLPVGQVIDLTFTDFAVLNGVNPVTAVGIPATTITVAGNDELKALSAEAIDSTHVAITYSDFLTDIGTTGTDYDFSPVLVETLVESGTNYGYDQKTVVITTPTQTPGTQYTIEIDPTSTIDSNTQGLLDADHSIVIFEGFGTGAGVLSDFALESATVTGYNTITATFSDDVEVATVAKEDFDLEIQETAANVTISAVSNISGNVVTLTTASPLLKDNTYILKTNATTSILRDSDGAELGITEAAFAGVKNGPRLIGATVTSPNVGVYRATLTFDEDITIAGVNNSIGSLHTTGKALVTNLNDVDSPTYTRVVSGSTLTIDNAVFNDDDENFTFSVHDTSFITNSLGVPVDDTYKSISAWGFGHSDPGSSVGNVSVTKKDTILVEEGNFDFATVDVADMTVNYIDALGAIATEAITSEVVNGDGDLEITMTSTLDEDRHYTLRIADPNVAADTLVAEDLVVDRALNVTSAEALSATKLRVNFSENIDENDVVITDFLVEDDGDVSLALDLASFAIDPGYTSATFELDVDTFDAGRVYQVSATGDDNLFSFDGNSILTNTTFFTGYNTLGAQSPVVVNSVDVVDAKTLRFTFSGDVDLTSFTPVNLDIFYFPDDTDPSIRTPLVVTNVSQVSSTVFELATSVQASGRNYFVMFDGVEDSNGLRLANENPTNFLGFTLPEVKVNLVTPSSFENELETNVVLSGQNLDIVQTVKVGTTEMTISSQSANSLVFTIPAGFDADLYDLVLIDTSDNLTKFDDAILVSLPVQALTVHSGQSQAIPLNVPNDGATETTLWLLVEDPVDLNNISSVVVDLSQIGGPSTVEMTKDAGTQPHNSQWYTYEVTVPNTVATSDTPYLLPVEVRKGSDIFEGTISVRVTKDVQQSVAPVIDQSYISPITVSPDGETPVKISAQVTDTDGASTITSVVADLGALGIGFKTLSPISELTEGVELETQFFESEEFTVPTTTAVGSYTINVVASDSTGEQVTSTISLEVSTSITGPQIDSDSSYISPRKSIPNDNKTEFALNVFVSDTDGVSDIQSVTASFDTLGLPPVVLTQDSATAGGEAAWYTATGLKVPSTAPLGTHNVEIIATDSAGGISNLILQLEVTHKDTLGDPPRVVLDRAYTSPRVAVNDGTTPVTLYAFVQDEDDDIESVVVNLAEIGQVGTENSGTLGGDSEAGPASGACPTGSNVIVCMNPSVKEGDAGQWFILPDVTISEGTPASSFPYQVQVTATDSGGKSTTGHVPVFVGTGDDITEQQKAPQVLAAIPTSATTLEVLFSKEMSATSILGSGRGFSVSSNSDVNALLPVIGATINPSGTVVTLDTSNQEPGKAYVLSVSDDIRDIVGRSVLQGGANRLPFNGFEASNKAPIVEYIHASDVDLIEIEFRDNLRPTSVSTSNINVYESDNTGARLDVLGVKVLPPGNVLQIETEAQEAEKRYRISIDGLSTYDGTTLPVLLNKGFIGYNLAVVQHAAAAGLADLNGDGRVDFADFTIFSAVYGTVYLGQLENLDQAAANAAAQAAAAGQALPDDPDATVPTTSEPAGGNVN